MKAYHIHIYKIADKYEVDIQASSRKEALNEALKKAKNKELDPLDDEKGLEFLATIVD